MERREDGSEAAYAPDHVRGTRPARRWSDAELIAAMRANEHGAFREFFLRFVPLLTSIAHSYRLPGSEIDERVTTFLDDAAMRLCLPSSRVPQSLAAYLAAAFRKRSLNAMRDLRRRSTLRDAHAFVAGDGIERIVPGTVSENTTQATYGPANQLPLLAPALERLALALERGIAPDDRRMLAWLGQRVPQRQIAEWLGTTHGAIRVRITRLRARLRDTAFRHTESLDDDERAEIERFFHRIDIVIPASLVRPRASPESAGTVYPAPEDRHS